VTDNLTEQLQAIDEKSRSNSPNQFRVFGYAATHFVGNSFYAKARGPKQMTQVDKMQSFNQRIDDLDKEIVELTNRRESLALDFAQGNKSAQKEVAQIDQAYDAAWKERGLLISAMDQLKSLAEEEQKAILEKANRERYAKAQKLAASIASTNSAVDQKLTELRDLLASRADSLNQLKSLGVVDAMYLNRMRDVPTAAFAAAGLSKFVNLHNPSPQAIRPLASGNGFLAGIGKPPRKAEDAA
jgi:hypothetical protein